MATKKKTTQSTTKKPSKAVKKIIDQPVVVIHTPPSKLVQEKKQDLKQLFSHVVVYISVNIFLIFINVVTDPKNLWFFWVLIGWGIGLAFHWIDVVNYSPVSEQWMEKEAKKIIEK